MSEDRREGRRYDMSPREAQMLDMAANGLTDAAIAHKLNISEATVGTYWGRIRIKLGPFSRTELVSLVLRHQQEEAVQRMREQNEALLRELKQQIEASRISDGLWSQIVENAPDAILLVSEDGFVTHANGRARVLFGYGEGEMNGLSLLELIPHRFREVHQAHLEGFIANPDRRTMGEHLETPALRRDGSEFLVRATLSAHATPDGLLVTCVLRDVVVCPPEG